MNELASERVPSSSGRAGLGETSWRASSRVLGRMMVPLGVVPSPWTCCSFRRPKRSLRLLSRVLLMFLKLWSAVERTASLAVVKGLVGGWKRVLRRRW